MPVWIKEEARSITEHMDEWYSATLKPLDYLTAQTIQHKLVAARIDKRLTKNLILWLEHPPVYTLGRKGGRSNILLTDEALEKKGIPVVSAERGGDVTYHGPGQLIAYPILKLDGLGLDIPTLVYKLETVMLQTARDFTIVAGRDQRNRGIWVQDRKLGSIGIAIRHGVTFHGMALNINLDLTPFEWINPCGLKSIRVTSLEKEQDQKKSAPDLSFNTVRTVCRTYMADIFGYTPIKASEKTLSDIIDLDLSNCSL